MIIRKAQMAETKTSTGFSPGFTIALQIAVIAVASAKDGAD